MFADAAHGTELIPHGFCFAWNPILLWLSVISDTIIALAYYSIPILLLYLLAKRRDTPFNGVIGMFGAFIILCGTTHLLDVIGVWKPDYWIAGFTKLATAGVSIATAIMLAPMLPRFLKMPSPTMDNLTTLPNRLFFFEKLEKVVGRARRDVQHNFAVLFVDLDGFKEINDSLGHAAGDAVLVEVGNRLKDTLRGDDVTARFGGDEFMVLMDPIPGIIVATETAQRIVARLREPFDLHGLEVRVGASVGVVVSRGETDADELVRRADRAMYQAKAQRRGSFHVWEDVRPPGPAPAGIPRSA